MWQHQEYSAALAFIAFEHGAEEALRKLCTND
jgi:hypothetical protein